MRRRHLHTLLNYDGAIHALGCHTGQKCSNTLGELVRALQGSQIIDILWCLSTPFSGILGFADYCLGAGHVTNSVGRYFGDGCCDTRLGDGIADNPQSEGAEICP